MIFFFSVKTHPCTWKWELHPGIVPLEEDYFDYLPIHAALCPVSREFLTLTREDVEKFQLNDFKVRTKPRGFVWNIESFSVYIKPPPQD